ncbi:hypothetical protein HDU98_009901 [Podochytrium sp. JEL0797]|nr:hypothetical protein HDU98_009901 [Podochytrium sp. JEL0797]
MNVKAENLMLSIKKLGSRREARLVWHCLVANPNHRKKFNLLQFTGVQIEIHIKNISAAFKVVYHKCKNTGGGGLRDLLAVSGMTKSLYYALDDLCKVTEGVTGPTAAQHSASDGNGLDTSKIVGGCSSKPSFKLNRDPNSQLTPPPTAKGKEVTVNNVVELEDNENDLLYDQSYRPTGIRSPPAGASSLPAAPAVSSAPDTNILPEMDKSRYHDANYTTEMKDIVLEAVSGQTNESHDLLRNEWI